MAILDCTCLGQGGNLGTGNCMPLFGDASGFAFGQTTATDGTKKQYDIKDATAFGTNFKDDFVNTDSSKRLFPVSGLRNIDFPQEDVQYVTDNTGQKEFLRNGTLSFAGEAWNRNSVYASKINSHRCKDNSVFVATDKGVWGVRVADYDADTYYWVGVPITALYGQWMPKKPGQDIEKVMVTFDFNNRLQVGELWLMTWEELGMTAEDFVLEGLLDVNLIQVTAPVAALGTTTVEYRLVSDYGDNYTDEQNVDGLVTASFNVENKTSGLAVANLAVTEVVDDKYTITYDTETTGNTIEVSLSTSATVKYEGSDSYAEPA